MGWGKPKKMSELIALSQKSSPPQPSLSSQTESTPPPAIEPRRPRATVVSVGQTIQVTGELHGSENMTIDGKVEGKILLKGHILTIGSNAVIMASIEARSVVVVGKVVGNIVAEEKVEVIRSGSVEGDISAPSVILAEGAQFKGQIDMQPAPVATSDRVTDQHRPL